MSELTDRIRAQQAGPPPTMAELAEALERQIGAHADHAWQQLGRCVFCGPCGVRLFQGTMPPGHEVYVPPRRPTAADEMRELWGKT